MAHSSAIRHRHGRRIGRAHSHEGSSRELGIVGHDVYSHRPGIDNQTVKSACIARDDGRHSVRVGDGHRHVGNGRVRDVEHSVRIPIKVNESNDRTRASVRRYEAHIVRNHTAIGHNYQRRVAAVAEIINGQHFARREIRVGGVDGHHGLAGGNNFKEVAVNVGSDGVGDAVFVNDLNSHVYNGGVARLNIIKPVIIVIQKHITADDAFGGGQNVAGVHGGACAGGHDDCCGVGAADGERRVGRELGVKLVHIDGGSA